MKSLPLNFNNFVFRQQEIDNLLDFWKNNKYLAIYGQKESGKSTLASYIYHSLNKYKKFWFDFRTNYHFINDAREILKELKYSTMPVDLEELVKTTALALAQHNCLLVLDNLESAIADRLFNNSFVYNYFIQQCLDLKIPLIFTTNFLPKEDFLGLYWYKLNNLSEIEAKELIAQLNFKIAEILWEKLAPLTQFNPGKLKKIVNYVRGDLGLDSLEEALNLFDSLKELTEEALNNSSNQKSSV